jgi:hypothetical protein
MTPRASSRADRIALATFALALAAGQALHLWTGLADQGDFARSTGFVFEGPAAPPAPPPPGVDRRAEALRGWDDRWRLRERWEPRWLYNASSYKVFLAGQVAFDRALTGDRDYSMRLGSVPARAALVAAFVGLLALALRDARPAAAAAFALLAGAAAVEASFAAFLNSAYEDQVAIVLLPALALLAWRATSRRSRAAALGAVLVAALVGASKAQLSPVPLLAAPFLWPALRAAVGARAALAALAAAQALAVAPLAVNPAARVNAYHAAYRGLLPELDPEALARATLGGAPVARACVGVGAFAPGGRACLQAARHGHLDVAALALEHPRAAARLLARALALGADLDLAYLGRAERGGRSFADLRALGLWRLAFAVLGPTLLVAALFLAAGLAWRASSGGGGGATRAALLLAVLGTTQHAIALADGLVEYPKHVLVGNYAVALALSLAVAALAPRRRHVPETTTTAPTAATA